VVPRQSKGKAGSHPFGTSEKQLEVRATDGKIELHLLNSLKGRSLDYTLVPHGNLRRLIAKAKASPESKTFSLFVGGNVDAQSFS